MTIFWREVLQKRACLGSDSRAFTCDVIINFSEQRRRHQNLIYSFAFSGERPVVVRNDSHGARAIANLVTNRNTMVPPLKDDAFESPGMDAESMRGRDAPTSKSARSAAVEIQAQILADDNDDDIGKEAAPIAFSHVQLYVKKVESLQAYKDLEERLNKLVVSTPLDGRGSTTTTSTSTTIDENRAIWLKDLASSICSGSTSAFVPQKRDVIKQLLVGFGMRVTGRHDGCGTRSFLVTSKDSNGIQLVVTAKAENDAEPASTLTGTSPPTFHHFHSSHLNRFFQCHHGRQGVAVLAFAVQDVETIRSRYQTLHPNLMHSFHEYENASHDGVTKVMEAFAYYDGTDTGHQQHQHQQPDLGTIIRFVETKGTTTARYVCDLPGLNRVEAIFDESSSPCYFDHWVSNVYSRTEFLNTLHDTLGFDPKVDFNAGVVAAGEAQIESTVTGNDSALKTTDKTVALKDQTQVYLPINNALSPVGHVHGFLQEIGQGIQHLANRVENLVEFISRCNLYREITGEGFTTLRIPRSYYGVLTEKHLMESADLSSDMSQSILEACIGHNITTSYGAVDLDLSRESIEATLESAMEGVWKEKSTQKSRNIVDAILSSRYSNLQKLLRHHISEAMYLGLVRNQILCDVQGDDILFQIFTCNILQNDPGDEAPFLEFIQRVCSECEQSDEDGCPKPIKPGCGGFGIRNFLTLFLSIEVSKAMMDVSDAKSKGDVKRQVYAQKQVDSFTNQLNESNPILTRISDAMTEEGLCLMHIKQTQDDEEAQHWNKRLDEARKQKEVGNKDLMNCSQRYQHYMRELREDME